MPQTALRWSFGGTIAVTVAVQFALGTNLTKLRLPNTALLVLARLALPTSAASFPSSPTASAGEADEESW